MLIEIFAFWVVQFQGWVVSVYPPLPEEFVEFVGEMEAGWVTMLPQANGFGVLPFEVISVVLPLVFGSFGASVAIRIVRSLLSLFTGGGGSA